MEQSMASEEKRYRVVDFDGLPGQECTCGIARRALADVPEFPGTLHRTQITRDAKLHYHRRLTETYYVLDCEPGAKMQLDEDLLPVQPGFCVFIPPGVRHRAIGNQTVLIVCLPGFNPEDVVIVEGA
jgi:mannose-6-phosphate isomerase-like protein (cupin superfamily)